MIGLRSRTLVAALLALGVVVASIAAVAIARNSSDSTNADTAAVATEVRALPPGLESDAAAKQQEICGDASDCSLINVDALPGAKSASKPAIYGQELVDTGIPASNCPEATAAYEKAGYAVDGYIGGGCPPPSSLDHLEVP